MRCRTKLHRWNYTINGLSLQSGQTLVSSARRNCTTCRLVQRFGMWKDCKYPKLESVLYILGLYQIMDNLPREWKYGWEDLGDLSS